MAGSALPRRGGMPCIGIGTYELRGDDCVRAVRAALQLGYRLIDTAAAYRNEHLVGEAIAMSGVPRAELFVVMKLAMRRSGSDGTIRQGLLDRISQLRIGYADCVLIHWPGCGGLKLDDAAGQHAARTRYWRVMLALQKEGLVRHLGVSNFLPRHFEQLGCFARSEDDASPPPVCPLLNQVELHPLCVQHDVDMFCCGEHGMLLQQYSPLGKGDARLLQHPRLLNVHATCFTDSSHSTDDVLAAAGTSSTYSVHDLVLMWGLAQGYCTLMRSHRPEHLEANFAAAQDFFASVAAASAEGITNTATRLRPLLTREQLEVVRNLRHHMGVEDADEDVHLCWYSSEVA